MCGEHRFRIVANDKTVGSSPHVRGARVWVAQYASNVGIIPACAGSTSPRTRSRSVRWDHPRMCGEHHPSADRESYRAGSSPHVRGARHGRFDVLQHSGIIPACAGSTCPTVRQCAPPRDHPRMCGEHLTLAGMKVVVQGSSPHVRGAHFENSIIPRKRKDNWLFFIQFRFENFLAFRYLLALLHPFLGVPTKDPSFASLGRLINCNPSQSTGDQSAPYTLKAICCSFLAE